MKTGTAVKIISDCTGYDENESKVKMRRGQIGALLDFAIGHEIGDGVIMAINAPTEAEANILVPVWAVDIAE